MDRSSFFSAVEEPIELYNGKALINEQIAVYFTDENGEVDETNPYTFPGYSSAFLRFYDSEERDFLIKNLTTQISRSSNVLFINASVTDMTFPSRGAVYFELGFVRSGYDEILRFGECRVI